MVPDYKSLSDFIFCKNFVAFGMSDTFAIMKQIEKIYNRR